MDRLDDLNINCQVRKALVRHWIDLGKLSMRSTRGVVHLSGELHKISNTDGPLDTAMVLTILQEIKRIRNVKRVTTDFRNWVYKEGTWQFVAGLTSTTPTVDPLATPARLDPDSINVYEVKEKERQATE